MGFAIAGSLIGLATTAGSAFLEGNAKRDAANAQLSALNRLKDVDIDEVKKLASETDIDKFKQQLEVQATNDPKYAAMRNQGAQGILDALSKDRQGNELSDTSLAKIGEGVDKNDPAVQAVIAQLLDRAKSDLAAGATLPPEFQAELVRSGLEKAGATGTAVEGRGATGSNIRRLLGSEGIALQQLRTQEALGAAGGASNLLTQRSAILSDLATLDNNLRGAKVQRAAGAVALGNAAVPSIGLTGADAANISISNTNQRNQAILGKGALKAQKALSQGEMWSKVVGAAGSAAGSFLGGIGGGMGGAGSLGQAASGGGGSAGGFAGIGSWIGGLLGSNKTATLTPSDLTLVTR